MNVGTYSQNQAAPSRAILLGASTMIAVAQSRSLFPPPSADPNEHHEEEKTTSPTAVNTTRRRPPLPPKGSANSGRKIP
jgi:hypothetical protein